MLRPRKALAAAPSKHQQYSRSKSQAHAARQRLLSADVNARADDRRSSSDFDQQQQQHPVDVLYSTLIARRTAHPASSRASHSGRAASAAPSLASAGAFIHASSWALGVLLPSSSPGAPPDPLLGLGPPSPSKIETPAQQLRRREQRFRFIVDAVETQLGNCSGRLHLPGRFINDAEFLYIVRSLPVAGLCQTLVTRLLLDSNKITNVDDVPWPPSLTHLSLSHNLITSVAGVRWPPHLRCLVLHSNALQSAASSSPPPAAAALQPQPPPPHRALSVVRTWPLHLTVLDLGRNKLSGLACVDVLQELVHCSALEQVCIYGNSFDKLELYTALLARGYPQPAMQRLQDDVNAVQLVRFMKDNQPPRQPAAVAGRDKEPVQLAHTAALRVRSAHAT